ncbi:hypothetical protein AYI70_g4000 [Smittium culicis]|uniref:Uncharacterized protein n=1 Tax=Smittium culicis TaxID=133412 RepID=A0A1R1Y100_9FUNG|nr:hypothetical protein AYI70_g4000 [Smittium culicis]
MLKKRSGLTACLKDPLLDISRVEEIILKLNEFSKSNSSEQMARNGDLDSGKVNSTNLEEAGNSVGASGCIKAANEICKKLSGRTSEEDILKVLDSKSVYQLQVAQNFAAKQESLHVDLIKELSIMLGVQKNRLDSIRGSRKEYEKQLKLYFDKQAKTLNTSALPAPRYDPQISKKTKTGESSGTGTRVSRFSPTTSIPPNKLNHSQNHVQNTISDTQQSSPSNSLTGVVPSNDPSASPDISSSNVLLSNNISVNEQKSYKTPIGKYVHEPSSTTFSKSSINEYNSNNISTSLINDDSTNNGGSIGNSSSRTGSVVFSENDSDIDNKINGNTYKSHDVLANNNDQEIGSSEIPTQNNLPNEQFDSKDKIESNIEDGSYGINEARLLSSNSSDSNTNSKKRNFEE